MNYEVKFMINNVEKKRLASEATANGYSNISDLCKVRALQEKSTYKKLYKIMVDKIKKMKVGTKFFLRDIIDTPPALLGQQLRKGVASGTIKNVKCLDNNDSDVEQYEKI